MADEAARSCRVFALNPQATHEARSGIRRFARPPESTDHRELTADLDARQTGHSKAGLRAHLQLSRRPGYRGEKGHLAILALSRLSLDRGIPLPTLRWEVLTRLMVDGLHESRSRADEATVDVIRRSPKGHLMRVHYLLDVTLRPWLSQVSIRRFLPCWHPTIEATLRSRLEDPQRTDASFLLLPHLLPTYRNHRFRRRNCRRRVDS